MTTFSYRAVHNDGRVHKGRMTASNENELAFLLREVQLELIEAKPSRQTRLGLPFHQSSRYAKDRIALCNQIEDLLNAGLPLIDAMATIASVLPQGELHSLVTNVIQKLRSGHRVCEAFATSERFFDPVTLALLRAGETSGDLATTFTRITAHLKTAHETQEKIRRALRYPLFLLCMAVGVTTFMMTLVVPEIITFLTSLHNDLPLMTRLLIACANFFAIAWWVMPLLLAATLFTLHLAREAHPEARVTTDRWLLAVPLLGPILRQLALTRMVTTLPLLLHGGLTLPNALEIAIAPLGNAALESLACEAHSQLKEGKTLSSAFSPLFPPPVLQMIKVGEASGQMTKTLERLAHSYDRESKASLDQLIATLEPTLTLLVGSILAWIVLAVLGPVYGSLTPLSQGI